MNITLFNKKYRVRRFNEQTVVRGYLTSTYTDFTASLHIHPTGTDTIAALPEGERHIKRLEGHGTDVLVAADESQNRKGDLLYYHGDWYECVSAQEWDHTMLCHLNYQFVLVPTDTAGAIDLTPPASEDDSDTGEGEDTGEDEESEDGEP